MKTSYQTDKTGLQYLHNKNPKTNQHAKTLSSPSSPPISHDGSLSHAFALADQNRNKSGSKGNSAQLQRTAYPVELEKTLHILDTINNSPASLCRTSRMATIAASKINHKDCLTERQAENFCKAKTEKNTIRFEGEDAVRLSLTSFQEQIRTLGLASKTIAVKSNDLEVSKLRLEGVQCAGGSQTGRSPQRTGGKQANAALNRANIKKAVKMCQKSNLNEFNRILSRMHLEQKDLPDQFPDQLSEERLKTRSTKRKKFVHSASVRRKVASRQAQTAREHVSVSIINLTEGRVAPERVRCNQIYQRHFLKGEPACPPQSEGKQFSLTESELARELEEIKQEIAKRNHQGERCEQQERFTKYSTSFIEEKLTLRKSLMRNYTFKKRTSRAEEDGYEDFEVNGWEGEATAP